MSLMTMMPGAQGSGLFANIAATVGLDESSTRTAMEALCPVIAAKLKARAEEDAELYESLIDLVEDGAENGLDADADALTGAEAITDGAAILTDVYGSRKAALAALRSVAGNIPEAAFAKLAAISATSVVAALVQSGKAMTLSSAQSEEGGGLLGTIIGAVVAGVVQGATRQLKAKTRRRSTSYSRSRSRTRSRRKSTNRKRRSSSLSLEDLFSAILGNNRK
jgi:hypothetical protein